MPATRSSTRSTGKTLFPVHKPVLAASPVKKRVGGDIPDVKPKRPRPGVGDGASGVEKATTMVAGPLPTFELKPAHLDSERVIPANLSFGFGEAKDYLKGVDARFGKVFETLRCRPFEDLEPVDPFRSLCTSIIGQQVSWLAARAINHKFRRLFDRSLPEKAGEGDGGIGGDKESFPSPEDVLRLDIPQLRSAGLSGRKAEYVRSLAEGFTSGRLSSRFLREGSVEEVSKALIDVRGIGQWTVDMFLIFTLRRPDVLPVGDLGVQKGLLKWILAAYEHEVINPPPEVGSEAVTVGQSSVLPTTKTTTTTAGTEGPPATESIVFPAAEPVKQKRAEQKGLEKALLSLEARPNDMRVAFPLPEGMDVGLLRSRLGGKKAKGNVYLTPGEMEVLTERWKPYRSLGVYYMWAVAEETT